MDPISSLENDMNNFEEAHPNRSLAYLRFIAKVPRYLMKSTKAFRSFRSLKLIKSVKSIKTLDYARPIAFETSDKLKHSYHFLEKFLHFISISYIAWDIYRTYNHSYKKKKNSHLYVIDHCIWHLGASLILPGFFIGRLIFLSRNTLQILKISSDYIKIIVPTIAVISIPLMISPIDHAMNYIMEKTFRKYYGLKGIHLD